MYLQPKLPVSCPRPFPPKPRQLPCGKRMTIAIGVLADNGIVVAADTEESDGYLKSSQSKIRVSSASAVIGVWSGPGQSLPEPSPMSDVAVSAIAGAGTGPYIDVLSGELWQWCLANASAPSDKVINGLTEIIGRFYAKHIVPFALFPPNERPEVALLIALAGVSAAPQDRHRLFSSWLTVVDQEVPYKAIGAGDTFAKILLDRLYPSDRVPNLRAAVLLAAYVAFHVKENVPSCGKFTDILFIGNGGRVHSYVPWNVVRDLETIFLKHARLEGKAVDYMFAAERGESLKSLRRSFQSFRTDFDRINFESLGL